MEETYYIFTNGSLARKDNTLRFVSEDGNKRDLPIENISDIYIFSEMNLNISLLNLLSKMGISVHFFNYYQYYIGSFYPKEQKLAGKLLTQQVEHYLNPEKRLFLAQAFINSASYNIFRNLRYYNGRGKNVQPYMDQIVEYRKYIPKTGSITELIIDVLTDSSDPKQYVKKLRSRDPELSANWGTICTPIQMIAADGKMRKIQATNTHGLLRIIQSIPSKKAEPFKQWLAMVGKQRLDEEVDPQIAIDRAIESYRNKGYSEEWIAQRMRGIEIRKDMTNEWRRAGITDSRQYASLTNILTAAWSGKTVKEYKKFKRLKKENLRDNMTNTELVLNALAEISTTEISKATNPQGITEATDATIQGGNIARNARESLEKQIGRSILSPLNSNTPKLLDDSKEK